jgi:hypothetical protein
MHQPLAAGKISLTYFSFVGVRTFADGVMKKYGWHFGGIPLAGFRATE